MIGAVPGLWLGSPPIEWVKTLVPLGSAALQLVAAILVARLGFGYGVRKTREERGFDRRMAWYDDTLTAIHEARQAVRAASGVESVYAAQKGTESTAKGDRITDQAREAVWQSAQQRTLELLRVLDLAVTRADVESEAAAASAHVKLRSMASWMNTSTTIRSGDDPKETHPYTLSVLGEQSSVLRSFLQELHTVEQAVIAGARAGVGYKPRLPELLPNKEGVIEIPSRDTDRTPLFRKVLRWLRLRGR